MLPRSEVVPAEARAIADALRNLGLTEAVLKPTVGASGFGVERVRPGKEAAALERLRAVKPCDRLLVQDVARHQKAREFGPAATQLSAAGRGGLRLASATRRL
jgi:hypothetical protein